MQRGFYFSIGSNIAPERHVPQIVGMLAHMFGVLWLSPVHRTAPHGMQTTNAFMNLIGYLETPLDAERLKARFNGIEEALGRDRNDPQKKQKDRVADIDIICEVPPGSAPRPEQIPGEPYLRPLYLALSAALRAGPPPEQGPPGVALSIEGAPFGIDPVCIRVPQPPQSGLVGTPLPAA